MKNAPLIVGRGFSTHVVGRCKHPWHQSPRCSVDLLSWSFVARSMSFPTHVLSFCLKTTTASVVASQTIKTKARGVDQETGREEHNLTRSICPVLFLHKSGKKTKTSVKTFSSNTDLKLSSRTAVVFLFPLLLSPERMSLSDLLHPRCPPPCHARKVCDPISEVGSEHSWLKSAIPLPYLSRTRFLNTLRDQGADTSAIDFSEIGRNWSLCQCSDMSHAIRGLYVNTQRYYDNYVHTLLSPGVFFLSVWFLTCNAQVFRCENSSIEIPLQC